MGKVRRSISPWRTSSRTGPLPTTRGATSARLRAWYAAWMPAAGTPSMRPTRSRDANRFVTRVVSMPRTFSHTSSGWRLALASCHTSAVTSSPPSSSSRTANTSSGCSSRYWRRNWWKSCETMNALLDGVRGARAGAPRACRCLAQAGVGINQAQLRFFQRARRRRRLDAAKAGDVIAHIVFQPVLVQAHAVRRRGAQHFQLAQPHARLVRRRVGTEDDLVARQLLGEFDDARLEAPPGFAHDVGRVHRHPEGLERVIAARLDAEVTDDEVHHRELADDRVEHRRYRVRPVARVDQHDDVIFGAHLHRRAQPVQRPVGTVAVHVRVQLEHLEAVFLDVVFQFQRALLRTPAWIEGEVADKAVRVFVAKLRDIGHIVADAVAAAPVAVAIARIARRRLDEAHVDAARLAVDDVGPVHHLEHALAVERFARVAPGLVDQVGGVQVGVDDHCQSPERGAAQRSLLRWMPSSAWASATERGGGLGSMPTMRATLLPR